MASKGIKGITVEFNGETQGLDKALQTVNTNAKKTQAALRDVDKALKLNPSSTELLTEKQTALQAAVSAARDKVKDLEAVQEQVKQQYAAGEIDQGAYAQFQLELETARASLKKLEEQQKQFGNVAKQVLQEAGQKVQDFGKKVETAGENITKIGDGMTKNVTTPIMAVGTAAVAAFSAVDDGTDTIVRATGASGDALDGLVGSYENVATKIPAELGDVSAAIGEVNTRFQTTGPELENQTELFLKFANITGGDVVGSVDDADKALEAWGRDASDLPGFLGMVAKASQDTGLNAQKLMQDVQGNSASFKELGFSLEESINFMSMLDANGVESSTALAGLKKAVVNLTDSGMDEHEALQQVIGSIKDASTETEALEKAQEVFGTKGAAEMATAIRDGRLDIDDLSASMSDYSTVVDDTFANTVDGVDGAKTAANAAKIALADLGGTISDMLGPVLEQVTQILRNAKAALDNMDEGQKQAIVKVALLVAAIGPAIAIGGRVVGIIGTVIEKGGALIGFLGKVPGAVTTVIGVASKAGSLISTIGGVAMPALSAAIGFLTSPIGIAVAAIVGAIAVFALLYNKCEGFRNVVNTVGSAIQSGWSSAMTAVGSLASKGMEAVRATVSEKLTNIQNAYAQNGGGIKGTVAATFETIKSLHTAGFTFIDNLTGGKLSAIVAKFNLLDAAKTTVSNVMESVRGSFSSKIKAARASISQGVQNINSQFPGLSGAASTVSNIMDGVRSAFASKIEAARSAVSQGIANIKNLFNFSWSLPPIRLPHFSVSGSFSINPPSVPKIGVSWYKQGGILNGAQIFGSIGDTLLGGGEAGAEAVLPLSSFYSELAEILDERLAALQHTGPLIEQHNEYHSPKALSPAEAARETREATRQAVRAIRK